MPIEGRRYLYTLLSFSEEVFPTDEEEQQQSVESEIPTITNDLEQGMKHIH